MVLLNSFSGRCTILSSLTQSCITSPLLHMKHVQKASVLNSCRLQNVLFEQKKLPGYISTYVSYFSIVAIPLNAGAEPGY